MVESLFVPLDEAKQLVFDHELLVPGAQAAVLDGSFLEEEVDGLLPLPCLSLELNAEVLRRVNHLLELFVLCLQNPVVPEAPREGSTGRNLCWSLPALSIAA